MLPLGYMYKRVMKRPEWLHASAVADILSVSNCVSPNLTNDFSNSRHNGYGLFNSPSGLDELAAEQSISRVGLRLFYFEAFEHEYDEHKKRWASFAPLASFETNVQAPMNRELQGFDVTSFASGTYAECSPLSCNGSAERVPTNEHCLIRTLDEARNVLERDLLQPCESGPFRIIAVYSVESD
jgi:hypothetical protein